MDARTDSIKWSARRIALLGLLSAVSYVGRLVFSFIPNVQPMSVILLLISHYLGIIDGIIVASLSVVLSNLFLGFGPWTIYQILSYGLVLLMITPLFKRCSSRWYRAFLAGLLGLLYGLIISLLFVYSYRVNHFWAYYLRGIPFDLNHCLGNIVFYLLLDPIVKKRLPFLINND
ncbi:ECF transporter S component [Dolosicoccus paucivorans]|uniref:ECF transporter S component n=1 Tax=Dolosicoccus paucivorans TaxID=84521 RepID=A0A2N6SPQ5_9LACT|nr:ECF transporter S component [Dolosicoccus paucivorans]PMB84418.1 ECF transporter S component [Dolosicoccus paucivorans]PMC59053.1 ECF transporter S component [Dolosicoccus paucivorans]